MITATGDAVYVFAFFHVIPRSAFLHYASVLNSCSFSNGSPCSTIFGVASLFLAAQGVMFNEIHELLLGNQTETGFV